MPKDNGKANAAEDTRPPVAPEKRGGGSRTGRETMGQVGSPLGITSLPKAELVATRGSGDWKIFVDVDAADLSKLDVVQRGISLPRGSNAFQFGPLHDLATPLQIQLNGATVVERTLTTKVDPILYFRFRNDFCQEVRRPTRGLEATVHTPLSPPDFSNLSNRPPRRSWRLPIVGKRLHILHGTLTIRTRAYCDERFCIDH